MRPRRLALGTDLRIEPAGPGEFRVRGSGPGDAEGVVDSDTLELLSHFTHPIDVEAAREQIASVLDLDDGAFDGRVERFVELGWLVDAAAPGIGVASGFGSLRVQHSMVRDAVRVDAYRAALLSCAPGRRVLDLGSGTGLLAMLAARAGAEHVYAVEASPIADLAEQLIADNGLSDRITVIRGVSTDIELDEPCDLLVHEILDTDPLEEDVLRYTADARERLLTEDALLLPETLDVRVCGVALPDRIEPSVLGEEAREAGRRVGLDLGAMARALDRSAGGRRRILHQLAGGAALTDEVLLWQLALGFDGLDDAEPVEAALTARRAGVIGGLALSFRVGFPDGSILSTSVHAAKTCWGWLVTDTDREVVVTAGERVDVRAEAKRELAGPRCRVALADDV